MTTDNNSVFLHCLVYARKPAALCNQHNGYNKDKTLNIIIQTEPFYAHSPLYLHLNSYKYSPYLISPVLKQIIKLLRFLHRKRKTKYVLALINTVTDDVIITNQNTCKPQSYLIREVIRKIQSSGVGGGSSAGDERPEVGNTRSSPYASMSSRNCPNNVSENWRSATQ
jgi:hypothetical protein